MDVFAAKRAMRFRLRDAMQAMPHDEKNAYDACLRESLLMHPWMHEADTILCYCSTALEPDMRWVIGWAIANGKTAALPVCTEPGEMIFCRMCSASDYRPGKYGILEPTSREEPEITDKTVCIVPGYAFTRNGRRLGKGGGYYDRFVSRHPGLRTIGVTYEMLLQEEIPCEAHDIVVDAVITDRRRIVIHENA